MNLYDDEAFFENYAQMLRSKKGLAGAGEWPALAKILPDFKNKKVLDLGCGYGWHSFYAAENGAKEVVGIDISDKMLEVAISKNHFPQVHFEKGAIEELNFPKNYFDVVFSSLALHYVADYPQVVREVASILKPSGEFIFTVEHPIFTAEGSGDWLYDKDGQIQCFPVDHYFSEGKRQPVFLNTPTVKYHRTLTTYVEVLLENGFSLEHLVEPKVTEEFLPLMKDELRRPMMLILSGKKIEK